MALMSLDAIRGVNLGEVGGRDPRFWTGGRGRVM